MIGSVPIVKSCSQPSKVLACVLSPPEGGESFTSCHHQTKALLDIFNCNSRDAASSVMFRRLRKATKNIVIFTPQMTMVPFRI